MKKTLLMKIGTDISRINKAVKITSAVATVGKIALAALFLLTALDAYAVVKRS